MKTSLFITSGQGRFFLIVVFIHPAIKTRCHPIDGIPYVESALLGGLLAADIGALAAAAQRPITRPAADAADRRDRFNGSTQRGEASEESNITILMHQ